MNRMAAGTASTDGQHCTCAIFPLSDPECECSLEDSLEPHFYEYEYPAEPCSRCGAIECRCIRIIDEHGDILHGFRFWMDRKVHRLPH